MTVRAPALLRVARILQILGTVALVALVVYLGTAAYSAAHLRPEIGQGNGSGSSSVEANGTVVMTESVNISNQGFYAISPLTVAIEIRNVSGGLIAVGGSPIETLAPGSNTSIPISIWVPFTGTAISLLTNDASLPEQAWVNATFASIFVIHLTGSSNLSWGAPFSGFAAVAGSPSAQPNGTVLVPVTVSFSNHASFSDVGALAFTVRGAGGATCGSGTLDLNVAAGSGLNQVVSFYASPSCNPSGGTILTTYSGNGLNVGLPTEAIP